MNSNSRFVFVVAALIALAAIVSGCATTKLVAVDQAPLAQEAAAPASVQVSKPMFVDDSPSSVAPASTGQRIWEGYFLYSGVGESSIVLLSGSHFIFIGV